MGNLVGSPTVKDNQDTSVVFLSSLVKDSLVTQEGALASQEEVPIIHMDPHLEVSQASLACQEIPQVPLVYLNPLTDVLLVHLDLPVEVLQVYLVLLEVVL